MSAAKHPQVLVEYDWLAAEVDEGIAPLILALWRRGFHTIASCQNIAESWSDDYPPFAYVTFETEGERDAFMEIAEAVVPAAATMIVSPDEALVALMADPEYASGVQARGGVWGYGFSNASLPGVLAALERANDETREAQS